jgi:hypothetical protein
LYNNSNICNIIIKEKEAIFFFEKEALFFKKKKKTPTISVTQPDDFLRPF